MKTLYPRLIVLGVAIALLLGHLIRYYPAFQYGASLLLGWIGALIGIGAIAGIMLMYSNKSYGMRRADWIMGAMPAVAVGLLIFVLIAVGGLI